MTTWTNQVPGEPGWYWLYGQPFSGWKGVLPEIYLIEVRETGSAIGGIAYYNGYTRVDRDEVHGIWAPAEVPEPPEEIQPKHEALGRDDQD